jgi:hypothetical protein
MVLASVALPGDGEPPIWIATMPPKPDARPVGVVPDHDPLADAIERWSPRLTHPVDRERLADALEQSRSPLIRPRRHTARRKAGTCSPPPRTGVRAGAADAVHGNHRIQI